MLLVAGPAVAEDGVAVHLSGASYGAASDGNPYNSARPVPDVGRLELVLNTSARTFDERVAVETQLFFGREAADDDTEARALEEQARRLTKAVSLGKR